MTGIDSTEEADIRDDRSHRLLTIPNVLCAIRLLGAPLLLPLAWADQHVAFAWLFLFLAMTDWVDGKLAIVLKQKSVFGARLDSWADATLYSCVLIGGLLLKWEVLAGNWAWVVAALVSYAVTTLAGFAKFGRWPSYHTRAAKTSWLLVTIGIICLLAGLSVWPFRVAMIAVTLTNMEAVLITRVLDEWKANVPSIWHAWQISRAG